jgi:hypothetical protein
LEQKVPPEHIKAMRVPGSAAGVETLLIIAVTGLALARTAGAQVIDHFNPISSGSNGVHLYGLSVSGMYSTGAGAGTELGLPVVPLSSKSASLTTVQAAASFGFARNIGKTYFTIDYSPSWVQGVRGGDFKAANHVLSLSTGRTISTKWSVNGSMNGILTDFNQLMFVQPQSLNVAMTPGSFDEFAAAVLTGRTGSLPLTQTINAAQLVSPETAYLYGGRILNLSMHGSVSYAYSTRSAINLSVSTSRSQFSNSGGNLSGHVGSNYSVPWTTNAVPSFGWSHSLTPRTTISVNLYTNRVISQYQDAYSSQVGVSIGRTMSPHWFLQGTLGVGLIKLLRHTLSVNTGPQITYGTALGYRVYAQTITASFNRSVSDIYGLGANATDSSSAAWAWKRPGSSVSLTGSFGYSRLISPQFSNTGSWTGLASAAKALNSQVTLSASYGYVQYPATILATGSNVTRSGVIVSLSWSPSARR